MKVTSHVTTSFGATHVILKTITQTRTLKGGGFGLTPSLKTPCIREVICLDTFVYICIPF
jgi:hypothetical protein